MHHLKRIVAMIGCCLVVISTAGIAMGAGTTSVAVQPSSDTVASGETTTVDIVVESATGGVGSIDIELSITDGSLANVSESTVAGNPGTVQKSGDRNRVRLAATGMDTADSGTVTVASVTLTGESAGTTPLALTVTAIGDESGESYSVGDERDGELTVEASDTSPSTDTSPPTDTSTETDSTNSEDTESDDSGSDSDNTSNNDDSDSGSDDTPTATATEEITEPPTATQTNGTELTATPNVTETATQTETTEADESSGEPVDRLVSIVAGLGIVFAGLLIYRMA